MKDCALASAKQRAWPRQRRHAARQVNGVSPSRSTTYGGTGTTRYRCELRRPAVCAAARNFYDNALHDTIRGLACLRANRPKTSAAWPVRQETFGVSNITFTGTPASHSSDCAPETHRSCLHSVGGRRTCQGGANSFRAAITVTLSPRRMADRLRADRTWCPRSCRPA